MASTAFRPDADMRARLAKGYVRGSSKPSDQDLADGRGYKIPNGGLFTTVGDLAKFLSFEMGYGPPDLLSSDSLLANYRRSYVMQGGGRYGVGFMMERAGDRVLIGHNGGVAGFVSAAYFDPKSMIGIVCLRSAEEPCEGPFLQQAFAELVRVQDGGS